MAMTKILILFVAALCQVNANTANPRFSLFAAGRPNNVLRPIMNGFFNFGSASATPAQAQAQAQGTIDRMAAAQEQVQEIADKTAEYVGKISAMTNQGAEKMQEVWKQAKSSMEAHMTDLKEGNEFEQLVKLLNQVFRAAATSTGGQIDGEATKNGMEKFMADYAYLLETIFNFESGTDFNEMEQNILIVLREGLGLVKDMNIGEELRRKICEAFEMRAKFLDACAREICKLKDSFRQVDVLQNMENAFGLEVTQQAEIQAVMAQLEVGICESTATAMAGLTLLRNFCDCTCGIAREALLLAASAL